jgi:hypothetical protein
MKRKAAILITVPMLVLAAASVGAGVAAASGQPSSTTAPHTAVQQHDPVLNATRSAQHVTTLPNQPAATTVHSQSTHRSVSTTTAMRHQPRQTTRATNQSQHGGCDRHGA